MKKKKVATKQRKKAILASRMKYDSKQKESGKLRLDCYVEPGTKKAIHKIQKDNNFSNEGLTIDFIVEKIKK